MSLGYKDPSEKQSLPVTMHNILATTMCGCGVWVCDWYVL